MKKCVLIGAGGHARVLLEALASSVDIVGALDNDPGLTGTIVGGVKILGDDTALPRLVEEGVQAFLLGIGGTRGTDVRRRLGEHALSFGLEPLTVIHPTAVISPSACLAPGVQVLAGAIVGASANLGPSCIVNTRAVVEHDCRLAAYCHIATGAVLAGGVTLHEGVYVGAAAVIRQLIVAGEHSVIGAGAAVVKDVPARTVVAGVPARFLKYVGDF